jgi:cytochrome c oxidase cbb3-type subunit 3
MADREIDRITGVETTGHVWDGIKELNNPLPNWWRLTFYGTILWAIGYAVAYPAWPLLTTATKGMLGYSSRADLAASMKAADGAKAQFAEKIAQSDVAAILADPELSRFAKAAGASAFKVHCVQCHGSGAAGSPGYPNLNDDDWIWGGKIDEIFVTINHGIRYAPDDDTRVSDMPAFGRDKLLDEGQISDVAWYVRKISGQEAQAEAALRGEPVFRENCASCHGDNGEGVRESGGPRLADAIWLKGGSHADIVAQVTSPRQGVMPAWGARLGETTAKQLAVYVHTLGGGEK